MSAQLIDIPVDDKTTQDNPDAGPVKTLSDEIKPIEEPAQQATQTTVETKQDDLPEKYRGKSIQDIIAMHQNAESLLGRQSGEVGELRSIVDDFIKSQSQSTSKEDTSTEIDIDILDNPIEGINKLIENHPAVKAGREAHLTTEQQKAVNKIASAHPECYKHVADPEFAAWVGKSKIRTRLFQEANSYNVDSADELFSDWEAFKASSQTSETSTDTTVVQQAQQQQQKAAMTGDTAASGGEVKKIYRRSDIIDLMVNNRPRYEALQDEIMLAYSEGRVR